MISVYLSRHLFVERLGLSAALFLGTLFLDLGNVLGHGWAWVRLVRGHLGVDALLDRLDGELLLTL
jgi:hypothetical protein